jgi:hypothetical protein
MYYNEGGEREGYPLVREGDFSETMKKIDWGHVEVEKNEEETSEASSSSDVCQ